MRIYLIGFMGAGKSNLGPLLAKQLGYSCIETDVLVEKLAGITIPEIFRIHGEKHFRELEKKVLHHTQLCNDTIVCTGGGTPCFDNNMEWMKVHGLTVYLSCDEAVIIHRIEKYQEDRPLFTDRNSVLKLLQSRINIYQKAHLHISNNDTPEITIEAILKTITKKK